MAKWMLGEADMWYLTAQVTKDWDIFHHLAFFFSQDKLLLTSEVNPANMMMLLCQKSNS